MACCRAQEIHIETETEIKYKTINMHRTGICYTCLIEHKYNIDSDYELRVYDGKWETIYIAMM